MIYHEKRVRLPKPKYIVFYNGTKNQPDSMELRLSDCFENTDNEAPCLECTATMLNINYGHNQELMKHCRRLKEYSIFVQCVREYIQSEPSVEDALEKAIDTCIHQDVLADFLKKHRAEVLEMILTTYNKKLHEKTLRREGRDEGIQNINRLNGYLLADKRYSDLERSTKDTEYQEKLEDKSNKLHAKEHELEQLTKDVAKARSVIQPFRNHKVDFTPPQITEKVPLFGTDKWIERQNRSISKQFTEIVRKIESLYKRDAERQVEAAQRNVLADYGEFYRLKRENQSLSEINQELESELNTWIGQLAVPSIRNLVFAVADALIGGQPVPISSGGGGNSNSDLRWDGRRPDEEDEAYRRRCMKYAITVVMRASKSRIRSR